MQKSHRIGRRVYTTTCEVVFYDDNNELRNETVNVIGNYNDKNRLTAKVAKQLGTSQVIIKSYEVSSKYYSMSMDAFVQAADKITD